MSLNIHPHTQFNTTFVIRASHSSSEETRWRMKCACGKVFVRSRAELAKCFSGGKVICCSKCTILDNRRFASLEVCGKWICVKDRINFHYILVPRQASRRMSRAFARGMLNLSFDPEKRAYPKHG